jgi:tripartite-type tricarboxylate transporter receptor subunit TctC
MNGKKILAMVLALCMLSALLSACGGSPTSTEPPATAGTKTAAPATQSAQSAAPASEEPDGIVAPEGFPKKEINVIVPLSAGGAFDMAARKMAECVQKMFDVNMVVENVEGGSGLTGMTQVLTSKADGYTLAFYSCGFYGNVVMNRYDEIKMDMLDCLTSCTTEFSVLCVSADSGITDFDSLKDAIMDGGFSIGGPGSVITSRRNHVAQRAVLRRGRIRRPLLMCPLPAAAASQLTL